MPLPRASVTGAVGPSARRERPLRLIGGLFAVHTALYVALSAVVVIYLPTRVAEVAPDDKVSALAFVSTISAVLVMCAQPVIGALSDRTAGPLGRRAPWMLGGALAVAVLLPALGVVRGIVALAVVWALCELAFNVVQAPAAAIVVDRVPVRRRGLAAGAVGAGFLAGSAVGAAVMGGVLFGVEGGIWVVGLVPLAGVVAFVLGNPDGRSARQDRVGPRRRPSLSGLVASVRRNPDFLRVFTARLVLNLAYTMVGTYLLYILQDRLDLSGAEAAALSGLIVAVILAASLPTLLLGGIVSDRTGRRKRVVVVAAVVMGGSLAIPLSVVTVPGFVVFAAVFGFGYGAYTSASKALATLVIDDGARHAGRELGIFNAATVLPQVVAPGIGWALVSVTGGYSWLFVVGMALTVLGAVAVARVRTVR